MPIPLPVSAFIDVAKDNIEQNQNMKDKKDKQSLLTRQMLNDPHGKKDLTMYFNSKQK